MYIVKTKEGEIIAFCNRHEDAMAIAGGATVDKRTYIVESYKVGEKK